MVESRAGFSAFRSRRRIGHAMRCMRSALIGVAIAVGACTARDAPAVGASAPAPDHALTARAKPASGPDTQQTPSASPTGCSPTMQMVSMTGMTRANASRLAGVASLCVDRNEVTVSEYAACVTQGKCTTEPDTYNARFEENLYRAFCNWHHPEGRERHPVNCVTFDQASAYCASRGARLPTDIEWSWIESNGGRTRYPWGNAAPDAKRVNGCGTECPPAIKAATGNPEMRPAYRQNDGFAATAPVASFSAGDTESGIHDLAGNVSEFVVAVAARESTGDLTAGGGCFSQNSKEMTASYFTRTAWASATSPSLGFRCVQAQ